MKQNRIGVAAIAKSLIRSERGGCEQCCAARQIKYVTMPMESPERAWRILPKRIRLHRVGKIDPVPADLLFAAGINLRAKDGSDELTAEADTEDGPVAIQRVFDQPNFIAEVLKLVVFVHALWPTHDDEACDVTDLFGDPFASISADGLRDGAGTPERVGDDPRAFARVVL